MKIVLCVDYTPIIKHSFNIALDWDYPVLPSIGHEILLSDFTDDCPKEIFGEFLNVWDITWVKNEEGIVPTLFVERKP